MEQMLKYGEHGNTRTSSKDLSSAILLSKSFLNHDLNLLQQAFGPVSFFIILALIQ